MVNSVKEVEGQEGFEKEIAEGEVVVQFHATWCQPCKQLAPRFAAASDRSSIRFARVDVDELPQATIIEYGIMSVPTLLMFRDGKAVKRITGRTANDILSEVEE
jgi:thioredoxin 1